MIKVLLFDLNKVLVTFKSDDPAYDQLLGMSQREFWKDHEEALEAHIMNELDLNGYLLAVMKKAGVPPEKLPIVRTIHDNGLHPVEGILPALQKLSVKYDFILMAGEGREALDVKLDKFNLRSFFPRIYATSIQELSKTDPVFYELILRENNLQPEEVVFIDDREKYIVVAKKLGLRCIHFSSTEQMMQELQSLG